MVLGLVLVSCGVARAAEGQEPNLCFEQSTEPIPWGGARRGGMSGPPASGRSPIGVDVIRPTHAAVFLLAEYLRPSVQSDWYEFVESDLTGAPLSERQKRFLVQAKDKALEAKGLGAQEFAQSFTVVRLFAVSEEDARTMAKVFIDFVDERHRSRREEVEEKLEKLRGEAPGLEKEISEAEAALEKAKKRQAEIKATTPYQELGQAKKAVEDLTALLNSVEVEIKGIEGEIKAIKQEKKRLNDLMQGRANHPGMERLGEMQVEAQVGLVGALARRAAAREQQKMPLEFWRLVSERFELKKTLSHKSTALVKAIEKVEHLENELASRPAEWEPLKVYGGKVEIRPVEVRE